MKNAAALLLLTSASAGAAALEFELVFAPEESVLLREVEAEVALSLDSILSRVLVDGEEQQSQSPEIEMEFRLKQSFTVRDELKGVEGGRPTELLRTFEDVSPTEARSLSSEAGDQSQETEGESELEGSTVRFLWDADEEEYDVTFADEDGGDEDLLEDLYEDMDLRELLPEGTVGEGDTWELDPSKVFRYVLYPCGRVPAQFGDRPRSDRTSLFHMADEVEGDAEAELLGVETDEESGASRARVRILADLTGELVDEREEENEYGTAVIELTRTMRLELEIVVLWDLSARRLHELTAEGEIALNEVTINRPQVEDGPEVEIHSTQELSGPVTVRYRVRSE